MVHSALFREPKENPLNTNLSVYAKYFLSKVNARRQLVWMKHISLVIIQANSYESRAFKENFRQYAINSTLMVFSNKMVSSEHSELLRKSVDLQVKIKVASELVSFAYMLYGGGSPIPHSILICYT